MDGAGQGRGYGISAGRRNAMVPVDTNAVVRTNSPPSPDVPTPAELLAMGSQVQPRATDFVVTDYFHKTDDPQLTNEATGTIDWVIEDCRPAMADERVGLMSPDVRVAGYDWQIKFNPNATQVSAYVRIRNLKARKVVYFEPDELALPLVEKTRTRKAPTVTAQTALILYNPEEPRVLEQCHIVRHRFTLDSPEVGWEPFTIKTWTQFFQRQPMRQAPMIQNGKLAFKVFVNIVKDPTRSLWAPKNTTSQDCLHMTGLLPIDCDSSASIVFAPLLHFKPFLEMIYSLETAFELWKTGSGPRLLRLYGALQWSLHHMCKRVQDPVKALANFPLQHGRHAMPMEFRGCISTDDLDPAEITAILHDYCSTSSNGPSGSLRPVRPPEHHPIRVQEDMNRSLEESGKIFSAERILLDVEGPQDMQALVDSVLGFSEPEREGPMLQTLELRRQIYDEEKRFWKKSCQTVQISDHLVLRGTPHVLYAVITHTGHLESKRYRSYFRPAGIDGLWYTYRNDLVECLTRKQAVEAHEGSGAIVWNKAVRYAHSRNDIPDEGHAAFDEEVAYIVWYIRADAAETALNPIIPAKLQMPNSVLGIVNQGLESIPVQARSSYYERWSNKHQLGSITAFPSEFKDNEALIASTLDCWEASHANYHTAPSIGSASESQAHTVVEPHIDGDGDISMNGEEANKKANPLALGADCATLDKPCDDDEATPPHAKRRRLYGVPPRTSTRPQATIDYLSQPYYKGSFLAGHPHGHGHLILLDGSSYTGSFLTGQKSGHGVLTSSNGDIYTGEFLNDVFHGHGKLVEAKTGNVHVGNWEHGKRRGKGTTYWQVTEQDGKMCSVCWEKERDVAFYECGHVVCCRACANRLVVCPVCRAEIVDVVVLYHV